MGTSKPKTLTRPARYLGIDEWIASGKKKKVVYDFIDHVGVEWMDGVEAVACDMNSDFQAAFEERCPHIQPVFDYFHIVKNFNEKVVGAIRKDEQERLMKEGNEEAAKALKRTRYILTSKRSTLRAKDEQARIGKPVRKGSKLFGTEEIRRKEGYEAKYDELLRENELLFTVDLVKEKLSEAYHAEDEIVMVGCIIDIMDMCEATGNRRLGWFKNMLDKHFEGIIAHGGYMPIIDGGESTPYIMEAALSMLSSQISDLRKIRRILFHAEVLDNMFSACDIYNAGEIIWSSMSSEEDDDFTMSIQLETNRLDEHPFKPRAFILASTEESASRKLSDKDIDALLAAGDFN